MRNVQTNENSREAFKSVNKEMLHTSYRKILVALTKIGTGTYEQIADAAGMEKNQVSRRLKEMRQNKLLVRTNEKRLTSSGCKAQVYRIEETGAELFLAGDLKIKPEVETVPVKQPELFVKQLKSLWDGNK